MPNSYFKFKKFTVFHDKCAMKVGTDSVLLGAWVDVNNAKKVLDIGSGCGLLSLMVAQRTPKAQITGIEIEKDAAEQAKENIENSEWKDRIEIIHSDIKSYDTSDKFDLILSNPPFFSHRSLKCENKARNNARHTSSLTFSELLECVTNLLQDDGEFSVVIPFENTSEFISNAAGLKLYLSRKTIVRTLEGYEPKRILLSFRKKMINQTEYDDISIEKTHHTYTQKFSNLVKDFYINL